MVELTQSLSQALGDRRFTPSSAMGRRLQATARNRSASLFFGSLTRVEMR